MNFAKMAGVVVMHATLLITACTAATPETAPVQAPAAATAVTAELPVAIAAGDAESEDEPVVMALIGWWTRADVRDVLGLSPREASELSAHLRNTELSYQLAHTRLRDARREQARMIEDTGIPGERILAFHREQLQTASRETLDLNISARLWVRERLNAEQTAAVLKQWPGFFRARWFRPARIQVRQGQVRDTQS